MPDPEGTLLSRIDALHETTQTHRRAHGCGAYSFTDGAALRALAAEHKPRRILELGTALGFTSACLAYGSPEAAIDTIEGDATHVDLARTHLADLGLGSRVTIHHGDFAPSPDLIDALRARLVLGGLLVCANIELAGGGPAGALAREFSDLDQWSPLGSIERGGTRILRKRAA